MRRLAAVLLTAATAAATVAVPAQAASRTWYVSASATSAGDGTAARPFGSLRTVENVSRAGDVIRVLPSTRTLDGGIQLKPNQQLIGSGKAVTGLPAKAAAPRLTNLGGARLSGDAVRLADGATVRNLRIVGAHRGGVYGREASGVTVVGNDVSQHNASCTPGYLIPPFMAPTNLPGVGIPIADGLRNGWAGIMLDADRRTGGTARISGNVVHSADCGDGIDVRIWGKADYRVRVDGNEVHSLRQGPDFESVLAIGLQAGDGGTLEARVDGNSQANLGNPDDPNFAVAGADSEGVFVNTAGPATISALIEDNTYTNVDGLGGFSANGLEMVTMGDGGRASVVVRDSHFSGSPGDVIEEGALGTNARLDLRLERVTAERSTGIGNTGILPFNNGDCVLAGSLGAGNDVRLTVRDSVLRNCANNGLSLGSNVVNGSGPTKNLQLDVDRSTITGNSGGNLGVRNFTPLQRLRVTVRRSDLAGSSSRGSSVADFAAEDFGGTRDAVIDVGGGNCLRGGLLAAEVVRYAVDARGNWWGRPSGPGPLRTLALGGSLDHREPLAAKPSHCR